MLWTPPTTAGQRQRAALEQMVDMHDQMHAWNRELKAIDERLQLAKAKDVVSAPGLRPGFWHVIRAGELGPPMIHVIETPEGGFREPDSGVFEELRRRDMWSERSQKERLRRQEALTRAHFRQLRKEREERDQEAAERFRAAESPGVSMTHAGDWRYRTAK